MTERLAVEPKFCTTHTRVISRTSEPVKGKTLSVTDEKLKVISLRQRKTSSQIFTWRQAPTAREMAFQGVKLFSAGNQSWKDFSRLKTLKAQHDKHKSYGTMNPNLRFLVHKRCQNVRRRAGEKDKVARVQVSVKLSDGSVTVYGAFHPINVKDVVKNNQDWEWCRRVWEQIVIHQAVALGKWLSGENVFFSSSLFLHGNDSPNTLKDRK